MLRFVIGLIVVAVFVGSVPFAASAGLTDSITQQLNNAKLTAGVPAADHPATLVAKIVNGTLGILGAIFFGLMVYAGFLWMTSRDEKEQIEKAQGTMRRAVIGLIIVLAAYAISKFITVAVQKGTSG